MIEDRKSKALIPAAQYARMSTEDQHFPIANQKAAILTYATKNGYVITTTYADAGKSGVEIKHRKELRRLLADVMSGQACFKEILVYDVSRWGRFQDVDEGAHYEFLCRSAGIPVRYCAEQFENDGSLSSSMMKALKRTMAAEYSRELGIKVSAGQRRLALLGFRVTGVAGYGLQRMMVSPDGRRRIVLKNGERKAIKTDHTILVHGPKTEVQCVRKIFELANKKMTMKEIAKDINLRNFPRWNGKPWDRFSVRNILRNEKYSGCNIYGKTTRTMCSPTLKIDRRFWIVARDAFVPIVTPQVFSGAQKVVQRKAIRSRRSDACYLRGLKKVLVKKGKLTQRLLKEEGVFDYKTYYKRFGSVAKAYELAGFQLSPRVAKFSDAQKRVKVLRQELYAQLKERFSGQITFINLHRRDSRRVVEIDGRFRVAIYLCRATVATAIGERGWLLRIRHPEKDLIALVCTMDESFSRLLDFYVFSPLDARFLTDRVLRENQPWLSSARKLRTLDEFCTVAKEIASGISHSEHFTIVDDIKVDYYSYTLSLGQKKIGLGPVTCAILCTLLRHAGQAVSRERLLHSVSGKVIPTDFLGAYIRFLRVKLGKQAGNRIRRVRGVGYMYVSPATMR
jgi:DNA invertase Pin-like site-specific DNA recombinase